MPDDTPDENAVNARFYLRIIEDLLGASVSGGGSRYANRDRAPSPLGGPTTDEQRDRRLLAMFALAKDVLSRLHSHRPPPMPERPAMLPVSDLTLMTHLTSARSRGERAAPADREVAEAFGTWRYELCRLEGESGSTLRLLLGTHSTLCEVRDRGGNDARLAGDIAHLEEHVARYWSIEAPYPADAHDVDRLVARAQRRGDLLATWLMNGDRPPRFSGPGRRFDPRGSMGRTEDDFTDDDGDF